MAVQQAENRINWSKLFISTLFSAANMTQLELHTVCLRDVSARFSARVFNDGRPPNKRYPSRGRTYGRRIPQLKCARIVAVTVLPSNRHGSCFKILPPAAPLKFRQYTKYIFASKGISGIRTWGKYDWLKRLGRYFWLRCLGRFDWLKRTYRSVLVPSLRARSALASNKALFSWSNT